MSVASKTNPRTNCGKKWPKEKETNAENFKTNAPGRNPGEVWQNIEKPSPRPFKSVILQRTYYKKHCFHYCQQPRQTSKSTPEIKQKSIKDRFGDGLEKKRKLFYQISYRKCPMNGHNREGEKVQLDVFCLTKTHC